MCTTYTYQGPKSHVNVNMLVFTSCVGFWKARMPFIICWALVGGAILCFISSMCLHC